MNCRWQTAKGVVKSLAKAVLCVAVVAIAVNGQGSGEVGADDPVRLGNAAASITLEVFADYQCPSCAAIYPKLREVQRKYPDKVAIVFRHLPLGIHDKAMIAAKAVEAARLQGKAADMVDMILLNQRFWTNDPTTKTFGGYARKLGLDLEQYLADFRDEETRRRIELDIARAKYLEIVSLPTVFVNDRRLTFAEAAWNIETIVLEGN